MGVPYEPLRHIEVQRQHKPDRTIDSCRGPKTGTWSAPPEHGRFSAAEIPYNPRLSTNRLTTNKPMSSIPTPKKTSVRLAKLQKRLRRLTGQAIGDYKMISAGDKVMVCISGGKDSFAMLDILLSLRAGAPIDFELVAVNLDQKQPGFPPHVLPDYLAERGVPYHILEQDTYSVVKRVVPEGKTMCSLCSRLRRGALYTFAEQQGFSKIALGHHRDDILETFFMNMFHGGKLKAMPAKLRSDNGKHIVIRPLAYCRETDLQSYAKWKQFPIIPCNLCGSQSHLQRMQMKNMLGDWQRQFPKRIDSIFAAMNNVIPSHLLDREQYDFEHFGVTGENGGEKLVSDNLAPRTPDKASASTTG